MYCPFIDRNQITASLHWPCCCYVHVFAMRLWSF